MRVSRFFLCLVAAVGGSHYASSAQKDIYFRWSSDGSGFRSLPVQIGYANVFRQAGLITETGSRFGSLSFSSSGTWFGTQLFYSPQFFSRTTMSTPDELYNFTFSWIASYNKVYNPFGDFSTRGFDSFYSQIVAQHEFSVSAYIGSILDLASTEYGDPGYKDRLASFSNRVPALRYTDYYGANANHPNSRLNDAFGWWQDSVTYIGPSDSDNVYA
jgi:hypothetical protein